MQCRVLRSQTTSAGAVISNLVTRHLGTRANNTNNNTIIMAYYTSQTGQHPTASGAYPYSTYPYTHPQTAGAYPYTLAHIQELLLQDTARRGPILIVITNIIPPVHCQSLRLPNQLPLQELRLCPPMRSGPPSQRIPPHTPVTVLGLVSQVAPLPVHTKSSPTSKDCLPKSVRPIPSRRVSTM
jgi:hypothetical protein